KLEGLFAQASLLRLPCRAALGIQVSQFSGPLMIAGQPLEPLPSLAAGKSEQPLERVLRRDVVRDSVVEFVPRTDELEMRRSGKPQPLNHPDQRAQRDW